MNPSTSPALTLAPVDGERRIGGEMRVVELVARRCREARAASRRCRSSRRRTPFRRRRRGAASRAARRCPRRGASRPRRRRGVRRTCRRTRPARRPGTRSRRVESWAVTSGAGRTSSGGAPGIDVPGLARARPAGRPDAAAASPARACVGLTGAVARRCSGSLRRRDRADLDRAAGGEAAVIGDRA